MFRLYLVIATSVFVVGCGSKPDAAPIDPLPIDLLKSFKSVFEAVIPRANSVSDEIREVDKSTWLKIRNRYADATYDVKKTDSLVSPFTAKITCTRTHFRTNEYATEAEAKAAMDLDVVDADSHEFNYALREGAWVLMSYSICYSNGRTFNAKVDGRKSDELDAVTRAFMP